MQNPADDLTPIELEFLRQAREITEAHHAATADEFVRALAEAAK
jgi:hypothetical protein